MSIMINGYERNLMNKLQTRMSKKEAEEAIQEMRDALYDDIYHMISPIHVIDENGNLCSNDTPVSTENHTHDEYVNIAYSDAEPTSQRVGDLWCQDYE